MSVCIVVYVWMCVYMCSYTLMFVLVLCDSYMISKYEHLFILETIQIYSGLHILLYVCYRYESYRVTMNIKYTFIKKVCNFIDV